MKKLSQPLRVEEPDKVQLITSRCINSKLWLVNNSVLRERIHAFLAKYANKHGALVHNFEIVGNHYHLLARFPKSNTAAFMKDLNARIAESVRFLVPEFEGGPLFERRYTTQIVPDHAAVIKYFFYVTLQSVSSKLCKYPKQYNQRILGFDAIKGLSRTYRHFSYTEYNEAKRKDPKVSRANFWKEYELAFERLPGNEDLSDKEYEEAMMLLYNEHLAELHRKHEEAGITYLGAKRLRSIVPGSSPKNTKKGGVRPRVLSLCSETRRLCLEFYLSCVDKYLSASKAFREGKLTEVFPTGMYRPPGHTILA